MCDCDVCKEIIMQNYSHLTFEDRNFIEASIISGKSFKFISSSLSKSCSTISREVLRNSTVKRIGAHSKPFNNCINRFYCEECNLCNNEDCTKASCRGCQFCFKVCLNYERENCIRLKNAPYVCNGCLTRPKCTLEKFFYRAKEANKIYEDNLTTTREGICLTASELQRLEKIISPLIAKGQSPHVICKNNKDSIMLDEKTIYKYINAGLFSAKNIDLLRQVKMKPRQKKAVLKVERACKVGRTYRDFLDFTEKNPDTPVVQMDSVIGKKGDGENVLLTIHFPQSHLMLAFLRNDNSAKSVSLVFKRLYDLLGHDDFCMLFPAILTDNGSEFSSPLALEFNKSGIQRTKIFYCDPSSPYQKGAIENNHTLLRRILVKGSSFNQYSQLDIDVAINHINSYPRRRLNDQTPFSAFSFFFGKLILEKLGVKEITANEVTLTPNLLKK